MKHIITSLVFCCALTACVAQPSPTSEPAVQPNQVTPDPKLFQLARDLHTKAEVSRHMIYDPKTPPELKAYFQGRVDALIEAADLAMAESVRQQTEQAAKDNSATKSRPTSEKFLQNLLP